jgi:ubiquinone/menaquinone biosynthesis C-methylase UbiE
LNSNRKRQLDYYETGVTDYESSAGLLTRAPNRAFARKAKIIRGSLGGGLRCLEIGAGSGLLTYFMANHAESYVACDLSPAMLKRGADRVRDDRIEWIEADLCDLPFSDNEFDSVFGTDIIHHLDDPVEALTEIRRVAAPGSHIVVLESNALNPLNLRNIGVEHEVRSFLNTRKNLHRWFEEAGWTDVQVRPAPSFTPAGPRILSPVFGLIDSISVRIPGLRNLCALWEIKASKVQ